MDNKQKLIVLAVVAAIVVTSFLVVQNLVFSEPDSSVQYLKPKDNSVYEKPSSASDFYPVRRERYEGKV